MTARLIINADDFGQTRGINRAVAELHAAGALTSATLMANGLAFDDAVAVALAHPTLGVGCHIVLTDGLPVSDPDSIPSLLEPGRKTFRTSLGAFLIAVLRGKITADDIAREAYAQVQKLQSAGLHITHLDTHKHTHVLADVAQPLLAVAERAGIPAIRNPFERSWSLNIGRSGFTRRAQVTAMARLRSGFMRLPQIVNRTIATTDGTIGISATGNLDAATLRQALLAIPDGLWELVCHPGYSDSDLDAIPTRLRSSRDIERTALMDIVADNSLHPSGLELINYGSVGSSQGPS